MCLLQTRHLVTVWSTARRKGLYFTKLSLISEVPALLVLRVEGTADEEENVLLVLHPGRPGTYG